jgi:hypothetical protein
MAELQALAYSTASDSSSEVNTSKETRKTK